MNQGGYLPWCPNNNNKRRFMVIVCHFVAMSLMAMWHLHLMLEKIRGGGK